MLRAAVAPPAMPRLALSVAWLLLVIPGVAASEVQFEPERSTLFIPRDCRFEPDAKRCAADNKALELCRPEKDAAGAHACLRANQSPIVCSTKKSASARQRCERINRIYQPCKGKRGEELAACVDQRRLQERGKK